jgi:sugar lactone lactonase YvrE
MITVLNDVEVAAVAKCQLGEGPVWNSTIDKLNFVDIFGKKVFTYDPNSNVLESFKTLMSPGAVIPTNQSSFALAMNDGLYLSDFKGEEIKQILSLEADILGNRMNDAKCDSHGRLFAGTMGDGTTSTGSLYLIDKGGATKIRDQVTVSNGLAWSPDDKTFYYIDSALQSVLSSNYSYENPSAINFKTFVEFPVSFGIPDGMCSDEEGGIWVAFFGGSAVHRFAKDGTHTHSIQMPVNQITSCAFQAGTSMLYITTASLDIEGKPLSPLAGNLFCIDVKIGGLPVSQFNLSSFLSL